MQLRKIILFCLPYGGGSAAVFNSWRKFLDKNIEIRPIEIAGRGSRLEEPFYQNSYEAIDDVYKMIEPLIDNSPYALFGHSLGCLLTYELLIRAMDNKLKEPKHVFFSGLNPPHLDERSSDIHLLPDKEFDIIVQKLGGTPEEFFENKELKDIFIPILRNDYRLYENHKYSNIMKKFNFDISVLNGIDDSSTSLEKVNQWSKYTSQECKIYNFKGGHFFINECQSSVLEVINLNLIN